MVFFDDPNVMNFLGSIMGFVVLSILFFFSPRLMLAQISSSLEKTAMVIEGYSREARQIVMKKTSKKPSHDMKEKIDSFLDFFSIQPVTLDPFGAVKRIEHIEELTEKRFKYFVKRIAPKMSPEEQAELVMGFAGAVSLNQVSKIVRHYVEMIKKTKNVQLAMLLQMQMPMIEKMSKALLSGTESFANGWAVGDSAGGLVVARMVGDSKMKEFEEDTLIVKKNIKGRSVILVKPRGPGGRLGKLGKTVERLSRQKVAKIITIDAAAKLEGEKTGSVAEGVGVAIGGIGVDRSYIENLATNKDIPLDSFVVKMSQEEAIMPMVPDILKATDKMIGLVEKNISETTEKGLIIVVGVGNTTGIGNDKKATIEAEKKIKEIAAMMAKREEKEKKKGWFGF
ncbi:MAG: DUF1512 family protein [Candidatus Aenigmarchaeota archaeon]|nr:DUF1512 family protein [Candidatus Aenigmarchaeota archaeon]